ncbi:YgaB family protein [Bacillus cihuensis]|uniref:YgaB family protein n=1 Tax=Bacillus cihuensis TaxID=1208599 RepID=UPI000417EB51|nr:YgaB family protein [Bacillus cihuensis]
MREFDRLINEQLKTMDKLLFIQTELERCQEIEKELYDLERKSQLGTLQDEIEQMKQELNDIQSQFEKQTEDVIQYYQNELATVK